VLPFVPQASVPDTEYVPELVVVITGPVSPVVQLYDPAPLAVRVTVCPLQKDPDELIVTVGGDPLITVYEKGEDPHSVVAVAVYTPVFVIVIAEVVADPTLHTILPVPEAVSVTVLPGHSVELDAVMVSVGDGAVANVTVFTLDAVPQAFVTVAVNASGKLVTMLDVVAPLLHTKFPVLPIVVSVADCPVHSKVVLGTIVNTGVALTETLTVCVFETPQLLEAITEYVPAVEVTILLVVAPLLQEYVPLEAVAMRVAL
jgi:hypothetical protein